tara:strand:- start:3790 stop:4809 length:1020 start_codon:yes stop_codon:yes gene_type:complete
MKLKNKYVIGCLVMFYEIEMVEEYIESLSRLMYGVENTENVIFHFCINTQEYLENIDTDKISEKAILEKFYELIKKLHDQKFEVVVDHMSNRDNFHNIAQYRRDLNYHFCEKVDFVIWGETDSMLPTETLDVIETVSEYAKSQDIHRYVLNFAYRKNWDASWDAVTHTMYEDVKYVDDPQWTLNNEASSKSYMSMKRMIEINSQCSEYDIRVLTEPKFDGSCAVISSDLIKSGVNIPHALTHCAEDTSFGEMAKIIMGDQYKQFCIKNILRVHNRRHPRKRMYILGEDNPHGLAGKAKGDWWDILEKTSKYNLSILRKSQQHFIPLEVIISEIQKIRKL